ncbi:MAG: tRNA 2-thiocytidine(32) synthetase TtcA, partial [bacterium]|nr:tRNA 2-thiocytidine(32) synthetase TtcA [bacterium]
MVESLQKQQQYLLRKVGKAINTYGMIEDGDQILVAVSGGKDSLILLEMLARRMKFFPIKYSLKAVHIEVDNVPYKINKDYLDNLCEELKVPLIYHKMEIELREDSKKSVCFTCSWNRRKHLFQRS